VNMKQVASFRYDTSFSTSSQGFTVSSTATNPSNTAQYKLQKSVDNSNSETIHGKYSVFTIADWFLQKGDMTHKKLQKLCYYAQAWTYALKGFRLADTDFQAWVHGPVSPVLYDRFKNFGYETIHLNRQSVPHIEDSDLQILEDVWDTYGDKTGNALEALSHKELPWINARRGYLPGESCSAVIKPEDMRAFYLSIHGE